MKKRFLSVTALTAMALVLPGCSTTYRAQAVSIAERICNVDSLRAQRDDDIRTARGLADFGLGLLGVDDFGAVGVSAFGEREDINGNIEVSEAPYGPGTEITRLVRAFETDLDASYRFASSSCQTYSLCMQMNQSDETECNQTRIAWQDAQTRFTDTSARLGEIRETIATLHVENQGLEDDDDGNGAHHHHPHSHDPKPRKTCETLAEVLTSDC
jgi:hypothetical protein